MKKIIILIPVYNDWRSLLKVLNEIDLIIKDIKNFEFSCLIINDNSSIKRPIIEKPKNFKSIKIINMNANRGHARCNAFGLRYINLKMSHDYVIVMDSDGEDRPIEIKYLIDKIANFPEFSVVAKRIKRSEGPVFKFLYQIHKLLTIIFTGKKINFGNYSCLTKKDILNLYNKPSLWSSFSGTVKKHVLRFNEIESIRGTRYFDPSKMSFFNLAIHSLSIIGVFKKTVFFRSVLMILILSFLNNILGIASSVFQILIVIFNLIIFVVSLREDKKALLNSDKNIQSVEDITH